MQDDNKKPTVEDQELADMIASMNSGAPTKPAPTNNAVPVQPASPPPAPVPPMPVPKPPAGPISVPINPTPPNIPPKPPTPVPVAPAPVPAPLPPPISMPANEPLTDLDIIKQSAMDELRPLVGSLDLPAEEKFDTLLLLIRSTDDESLIKPAHEAAQKIEDDKKRAQALLDIVKEIDFFENTEK